MSLSEQNRLVESLCKLLEQQHASKVEHIETHISHLLLVANRAYKIKKPVNFGFLDFSTLEKRRHFCFEEQRLNSRLAADLYQGVISISGDPEKPLIDDNSSPIEYMIEMQRFEPGHELTHLLEADQLPKDHIKELADLIARFHQDIDPIDNNSTFGTTASIKNASLQNFQQIKQHQQLLPDALFASLATLEQWTMHFFQKHQQLFDQRRQQGFVRECHGDLHLGNITLNHGKLLIFDGIEFNDDFRWIDVISDLAFLLMDCHYHAHHEDAWLLLNSYLDQTLDYAGLTLLPFYLCYRAMVRAKVNVLRLSQLNPLDKEAELVKKDSIKLIKLAASLSATQAQSLTITHGLSGSGKSFQASRLMQQSGAIRLRSDRLRQIYPQLPASRYSENSRNQIYDLMLKIAEPLLIAGFNVILDATFLAADNRQKARQLAHQRGVNFQILHTEVDTEELKQRLERRASDDKEPSEADMRVVRQQQQTQEPLTAEEKQFLVSP